MLLQTILMKGLRREEEAYMPKCAHDCAANSKGIPLRVSSTKAIKFGSMPSLVICCICVQLSPRSVLWRARPWRGGTCRPPQSLQSWR